VARLKGQRVCQSQRYDPKKRGGTDNERLFFNWMGNAYRLHCIFPEERSRCGFDYSSPPAF
jgi:hypothetical protein